MTTCNPCLQQPQGPTDEDVRAASCWWALDVLDLADSGKCCQGFGIGDGFGLGATSDATLAAAANAVAQLNLNWGGACAVDPTVAAFQAAWNGTSDPNMWQASSGIGTLTVDGKYGQQTSQAYAAATGALAPTPCTSFSGGATPTPASYSAAVVAAATALDAHLAESGCTSCLAAGQPPSASDPLSALVAAFKNAILTSPGCTSTSCSTVTGSTINMSSAACQQSFGPGTIADLTAVLGSAKQSGSTACTDANCNCLAAYVAPPPAPTTCPAGQTLIGGVCTPNVTPPTPSSSSSSSSNGGLIAGAILLGLGGAGVYYAAKKHRKPAHASAY